jgi:hypothetical protein
VVARILQYINPTDDKSYLGKQTFVHDVAKLIFTKERDSGTDMYESGFKMKIRRDYVQGYVNSVIRQGNLRHGQNNAVAPPPETGAEFFSA